MMNLFPKIEYFVIGKDKDHMQTLETSLVFPRKNEDHDS